MAMVSHARFVITLLGEADFQVNCCLLDFADFGIKTRFSEAGPLGAGIDILFFQTEHLSSARKET